MKSTQRRKAERIQEAVKAYDKLKRNFPESKFMKESDEMLAALNKEQEQLVKG